MKEAFAVKLFEKSRGMVVRRSGLFVDKQLGFLGASPDGLVGDNALVEVKCLHSVHKSGKTLKEAIKSNLRLCLRLDDQERIRLKKNHHYYFQIQGQLNICDKNICFFIVYVNDDAALHVEAILRDEQLWKNSMLPKLTKFYLHCVLPEIIYRKAQKNKNVWIRSTYCLPKPQFRLIVIRKLHMQKDRLEFNKCISIKVFSNRFCNSQSFP